MKPNDPANATNDLAARLAALEAQTQTDRDRIAKSESRLMKSESRLRVTWAVAAFAALVSLTIGWHKDAIAQGYGMTLAQAATRIAALETKTASMSAITDPNTSQPTVRFTGVNVQVVSGSGYTEGTVNGTGNLIVGYNELRGSADLRTGSHNVIVGLHNNYSGDGGAVIGYNNAISSLESCVLGGQNNTASATSATVSGGQYNIANGSQCSVSGGQNNTASGSSASVSGGAGNTAGGSYSSVSGGNTRTAPNQFNWVAGTQAVQ